MVRRSAFPRLLELLKDEGLRATFFVPGWVAENRTERVEAIVAAGHEIGHHGYLHLWVDPDDPAGEEEELVRGLEALERTVGVVPEGYRSPAGETSPNLIRLLSRHGFLYDSSLMDDVNPYRHVFEDGSPGPIELPWHWSLDDAPFLLFSIKAPRPIFTNEHILSIWKAEFRGDLSVGRPVRPRHASPGDWQALQAGAAARVHRLHAPVSRRLVCDRERSRIGLARPVHGAGPQGTDQSFHRSRGAASRPGRPPLTSSMREPRVPTGARRIAAVPKSSVTG
ncbi:MAG: polysaccharide deacetylase family protein [Burkholderiaceae bacterium]|nr:polysaccharide deacetylase family protein [Burkholderiaceae bacterium]